MNGGEADALTQFLEGTWRNTGVPNVLKTQAQEHRRMQRGPGAALPGTLSPCPFQVYTCSVTPDPKQGVALTFSAHRWSCLVHVNIPRFPV